MMNEVPDILRVDEQATADKYSLDFVKVEYSYSVCCNGGTILMSNITRGRH
jgi:hypothetical protein